MEIKCSPISLANTNFNDSAIISVANELCLNLNRIELKITSDYYSSFRNFNTTHFQVTADKYLLGSDRDWLDESLLCPEMPIPNSLSKEIKASVPHKFSETKQAVSLIHAGRRGCMSPVHFDWDHKWVAHACLTGRKRFFIFPPDAGWLLNPVINTSALCIPRFSESDRYELIRRLDGVEIILEAGQGILFPSMFWHGVFYDESSFAVSVRFEPHMGGRPFAVLPRSWYLQRLVWRFFRQGFDLDAKKFFSQYLEIFFDSRSSWKNRYRRINKFCQESLSYLGEQKGVAEFIGENFSTELALASRELRFYYDNKSLAETLVKNDKLQEAADYIFEADSSLSDTSKMQVASYALNVRIGLPPKRGIVYIQQE